MMEHASESNAKWISMRRSKRIRSLPMPANQACVRSTTQRCWPSWSLRSMPLRAIRAVMPRCLRALRQRSMSSALSACSLPGQRRARPGFPPIAGNASSTSSNATESCRLAPVTQTASGTPFRSTITCRLLPSLPRSVGFGPVYGPPGGRPRWRRPDLLGSDPVCRRDVAQPGALDVNDATPRWLANHAADASRSCRCHRQVPKAGLPTQCPCAAHRRCR